MPTFSRFQNTDPSTPVPTVTGSSGGNAALASLITTLAKLNLSTDGTTPGIPEVQILGTLIGTGLADTGTGDATNLLVATQQAFSTFDWVFPNATMADSGQTDPVSGATASTLTETVANTTHYTQCGFQTATVTEVSFSIFLKQGLRTRAQLYMFDSLTTANFVNATFDLAGGAVGIAAAVGGTFTTPLATITAKANGYYLCTLSANFVSGSGSYSVVVYADSGSGAGAASITYAGNTTGAALTLWGAKANTGVPSAYVALNANGGAVGSTVQQTFLPNGGTTAYWGTQTPSAWIGFDAGVPVQWTRYRFAPRPSSATTQVYPTAPDYAATINGTLLQTSVSDAAFGSPTTADTITGSPYYPRYWLSERTIPSAPAARYIRLKPPSISFGGISAFQVFAALGTTANACPVQPVITPNGGRYPSLSTPVSIVSTAGATIYYTTDGSTPTTSSTLYTGPFTLPIGSGATVTVKAIANMPSLSTPNSPVTISAPYYGYGYKPNDNWYDHIGQLMEAHAGSIIWDPNSQYYYWIGQFQNINSIARPGHVGEPNGFPDTFLYQSSDLLNWTNMGSVLPNVSSTLFIGGRYHMLYNALNNNYVVWLQPQDNAGNSTLFYASTSGSDITKGWSWNMTPIVSNTFYDYDIFLDSDGVSAYAYWRDGISIDMKIQQLNSSYTGFQGSALTIPYTAGTREGPALFKYPYATGGTYFVITSLNIPYDSTIEADLRYISSTGATPLAGPWTSLNGLGAYASDPVGTNYNGQPTHVVIPRGAVQPFLMLDYWTNAPNYNSRYVWLPIVVTNQTLVIQQPASWDPSQLATTYTLNALTLTGTAFSVGATQGTPIGTVGAFTISSWVSLTDSHSGAVQLVGGVIQVGATPPGTAQSFNISLTETPPVGSPRVTVISITEAAVSPSLSGALTTYTTNQAINLTSLGGTDWAAYGYNVNQASIERKSTGGSKISVLTQVGGTALANFNNTGGTPKFSATWTDGTPDASIASEAYIVFCNGGTSGTGMSFTVPADTTLRTLLVYVAVSFNASQTTQGKLTATLSDGSAGPYVDTGLQIVNGSANKLGLYTITYEAASASQTLTVSWVNNTAIAQNVQITAAVLQ